MSQSDGSTAFTKNAVAFYNALRKEAKRESMGNGHTAWVYRGKVVTTFHKTGISQSYYTRIRRTLIDSGCIKQLQQGSRNTPTVLLLLKRPVESQLTIDNINLTEVPSAAIMAQSIKDLQDRIGSLKVVDALSNFEIRIREVERICNDLQGQVARLTQVAPRPARR